MPDTEPIKYLDLAEFVRLGFLQEANRRFFHPLGLALEVHIQGSSDVDDSYRLSGIWDCREDPEGVVFDPGLIDQEKIRRVQDEAARHAEARAALFGGSRIQPSGWSSPTAESW